jgi:hypothetical protein
MPDDQATFLEGKVLKRTLPALSSTTSTNEPRLKRLLLPQGELAQFYDGEEGMRYLAFIGLQTGAARGHHYHKYKEEWVYLIQGELLLLVEDIESKLRQSVILRTGDYAFISPNIAHALCPLQSGHAVEYSPTRFDRSDTYPYPLT